MALTSANHSTHHAVSDLKARVVHLIAGNLAAWREARRRRGSLATLQRLEDWQLDDTGFTRGEVEFALELPLTVNAARWISERAARRRADEEAAMHRKATDRARALSTGIGASPL